VTEIKQMLKLQWNGYYSSSVKAILFVGTNFRGFYRMQWSMVSWICGFKQYIQQSMRKLYFVV